MPPTRADIFESKHNFYQVAGFPGVIGCIDQSHIPIVAPHEDDFAYVNRKKIILDLFAAGVSGECAHKLTCDGTLTTTEPAPKFSTDFGWTDKGASLLKELDASVVSQPSVFEIPAVKIGPIKLAILNCNSDGVADVLTPTPVLLHSF